MYSQSGRLELHPGWQAGLAYVLARVGRREAAEAMLRGFLGSAEFVSPIDIAEVYIGLGDEEQALASLEKAYDDRSGGVIELRIQLIRR